jgi:hypothetical protein
MHCDEVEAASVSSPSPKMGRIIAETALAINVEIGEFSTLIAAVVYTGLTP